MENQEVAFQKQWEGLKIPTGLSVERDEANQFYGRYTLEPLHKGFGITIGHALRRGLLSSLPGIAVAWG